MRAYGLRNFIHNLEKDSYFHWTFFIGHHSALEEVGIHSGKKLYFSSPDGYFMFLWFLDCYGLTLSPEYMWTRRNTLEHVGVLNNSSEFFGVTTMRRHQSWLYWNWHRLLLEENGKHSMEKKKNITQRYVHCYCSH